MVYDIVATCTEGLPVMSAERTPVGLMLARDVGVQVQFPPGVGSVNETLLPAQTVAGPEIAAGSGLTVMTSTDVHPPVVAVKMILVAPVINPLTSPPAETLAMAEALLDQDPGVPVDSISVRVEN